MRLIRSKREYFYHAVAGRYMDIDDLRDMQERGAPLVIRDEETGEDITRILLA
jgi:polyhydroxyalkanoate synthesis regulator protein